MRVMIKNKHFNCNFQMCFFSLFSSIFSHDKPILHGGGKNLGEIYVILKNNKKKSPTKHGDG